MEDAAKARLKDQKTHKVCRAGPHLATITRSTVSQVCGTQEGKSTTEGGHLTRLHPKVCFGIYMYFKYFELISGRMSSLCWFEKQSDSSSLHLYCIPRASAVTPSNRNPPRAAARPAETRRALPCPACAGSGPQQSVHKPVPPELLVIN